MGLQFHETVRGKVLFESQLPSLIKALSRIANALEQKNESVSDSGTNPNDIIRLYGKLQRRTGCKGMLCPRCGKMLNPSISENALSRHEDIYICSECGTDEALMNASNQVLPLDEWFLIKSEERKESV